jgi:N-acetyltransferase
VTFDLQPILKGNLLELRPLRAEDYNDLYAVAADPLIWQQHIHTNRHQEDVFKTFFNMGLDCGGAFVVLDAKSRKVIGSTRFYDYNKEKSEIEIGWTFLSRSYWGGLYNRELKRLMLEHAFQFVNSVIFIIGAKNLRSQKAIEKIGATLVGTKIDVYGQNHVVYQITVSAWASLQKTSND